MARVLASLTIDAELVAMSPSVVVTRAASVVRALASATSAAARALCSVTMDAAFVVMPLSAVVTLAASAVLALASAASASDRAVCSAVIDAPLAATAAVRVLMSETVAVC